MRQSHSAQFADKAIRRPARQLAAWNSPLLQPDCQRITQRPDVLHPLKCRAEFVQQSLGTDILLNQHGLDYLSGGLSWDWIMNDADEFIYP